jgi:hypothetical protein
MSAPKYCTDPDSCNYSDCPTAFCDRNAAPTCYATLVGLIERLEAAGKGRARLAEMSMSETMKHTHDGAAAAFREAAEMARQCSHNDRKTA